MKVSRAPIRHAPVLQSCTHLGIGLCHLLIQKKNLEWGKNDSQQLLFARL